MFLGLILQTAQTLTPTSTTLSTTTSTSSELDVVELSPPPVPPSSGAVEYPALPEVVGDESGEDSVEEEEGEDVDESEEEEDDEVELSR